MSEEFPPKGAAMPRHVAIIMDGNGRWAKQRGMPRAYGHRQGVLALEPIIEACGEWGIEALTIFAFSTENWARPKEEIAALMGLIVEFFNKKIDELDKKGVCIRMLGDLRQVPELQRKTAEAAMARTAHNAGLKLNIALNYGSRQEIVRAARLLAQKCRQGEMRPEDIDENAFEDALYTRGLPPVDLLIRTSGEERLSNFLLYQCAYAEFLFVPEFWPDFTREVFARALATYFGRAFGKHKLIPKVSPNKTVEGAAGGLVGGVFAALVMYGFSVCMGDNLPIWLFLGLGLAGSVVTQVGDIVASYIKRICGVKDFGKIFPGHGGLLDRMDGIMYNSVALCIFVLLVTA